MKGYRRKRKGRGRQKTLQKPNDDSAEPNGSKESKLNVTGEPMDVDIHPPLSVDHTDKKEPTEDKGSMSIDANIDGDLSSLNGDLVGGVDPDNELSKKGGATTGCNAVGETIDHESENSNNELEELPEIPPPNSIMELIRSRFHIDDSAPSPINEDDDSDDLFPPSNFDFLNVLEEIERKMEEEDDENDDSECRSEILKESQEIAAQFGFHVPEEEILADFESVKNELKFPPRPSAAERKEILEMFDPFLNADETSFEECSHDSSKKPDVISASPPSNSDALDKQGRVESLECATNLQEDETTQQEESVATNHDKLLPKDIVKNGIQNLEINCEQVSSSSSPIQSEISAQGKVQATRSPEMSVTSTLGENSNGISASSSDLTAQTLNKRKVLQTEAQIHFPNSSSSASVNKPSTSNPEDPDFVDLVSPPPDITPVFNSMIPKDLIIMPVSPTKDERTQDHSNSLGDPPSIVPIPSSSSHSEDELNSAQPQNEGPIIIGIKSLKKTDPLFRCKFCGENYFCYDDDLFRKHVFLKHGFQITEDKYFDESRISSSTLSECNKCGHYVLKIGRHNMECKGICNLVEIEVNRLLKHGCGVCKEHFSARYELRRHIKQHHVATANTDSNCKKLSSKLILNPDFRCAQCLKRFSSTLELTSHCTNCTDIPTPETVQELAESYFHCDICNVKHSSSMKIQECYFGKEILRCALCFDMFYDKVNFGLHLRHHHDLETQGDDKKPKLTFSCPLCIDKIQRGTYQEIFPHIVADHYQPIFDAMNQITDSNSTSTQGCHLETLSVPPASLAVNQNQSSNFSNPISATSITSQQADNQKNLAKIAKSIKVKLSNPTNFPLAKRTTRAPAAAGGTTTSSVIGGWTSLLPSHPTPTASASGGSKSIHLPLQHPVYNALGNILQGGFRSSPRILKPPGLAKTIRFPVTTPDNFLRQKTNYPAPAPSPSTVPNVSNSRFSPATVTDPSPASSAKTNAPSQIFSKFSNQIPITCLPQRHKRIKLTEADDAAISKQQQSDDLNQSTSFPLEKQVPITNLNKT